MATNLCEYKYDRPDDSRFGEPMLWIGIYVAAASIVCVVAMGVDIIRSSRWGKVWISPKFFIFNAAVLTILGVAVKIPNDINGKMPGLLDQLAKLSGILLLCIAMTHAMPSLGVMDGGELVSNMTALGIIVISTAVNVWFQIKTKLIASRYAYLHLIYTITMLFMYSLLVMYSLSVAPIKLLLEKKYDSKHTEILGGVTGQILTTESLKEYVKKYWLMALTSSPGYVLRTSGMSLTGTLLCGTLVLLSAGTIFHKELSKGCYVNSDYKWSAGLILGIQAIAVVVVGIVLFINLVAHFGSYNACLAFLNDEKLGLQPLEDWKKGPLPFHVRNRAARRVAYHAKKMGVHLLILFIRSVMFLNKIILYFFALYAFCFMAIILLPCWPFILCSSSTTTPEEAQEGVEAEEVADHHEDFGGYILHVNPDEDAKDIVKKWKDYPDRWIRSGQARCPQHLHDFINNVSMPFSSSRFGDCWSLHIATLTCIVHFAFIETNQREGLKTLIEALEEGWPYFVLVDRNSGDAGEETLDMAKTRDTAQMVWEKLLIQEEWLDKPRKRFAAGTPNDVIKKLRNHATCRAGGEEEAIIKELPLEVIAARNMCSVASALLGDGNAPLSFDLLKREIAAAAHSCLACLSRAILTECSRGRYGSREEHVRLAAKVLGETEMILEVFEPRQDSGP